MAYLNPDDQKTYARRHYKANAATYKARARAHNAATMAAVQAWVWTYLQTHPCIDCGESDPIVLEFDHRDPATKVAAISNMVRRKFALTTVQAEIAKCDVRCANCHRRKTYRERGFTHRGQAPNVPDAG